MGRYKREKEKKDGNKGKLMVLIWAIDVAE